MKNNSRESESLAATINYSDSDNSPETIIFSSSSDVGVIRNKGRNGARYAPKAIINTLKRFNNHSENGNAGINIFEVTSKNSELTDFTKAQEISATKIYEKLNDHPLSNVIHIGGGHDHVYPLLLAIDKLKEVENILIVNIDAHCDTRVDTITHSGTPFRDFSKIATKPFHIIQYGIQKQANSKSTMSPLEQGSVEHLYLDDLKSKTNNFTSLYTHLFEVSPLKISKRTAVVISLDCDAIDGSQMQAVSAVNGNGIPLSHIHDLIKEIKSLTKARSYFGIYEFNPVYDNINQLGSRSIASLIYNYLG